MKNPTKEALEAGINLVDQIVELTGQSRFDVIAAMKRFEKKGMGKFVVGRKGHPSRFEAFVEAPKPTPPNRAQVEAAVDLLRQYILGMDTNILHPLVKKHKSGTYPKTGT